MRLKSTSLAPSNAFMRFSSKGMNLKIVSRGCFTISTTKVSMDCPLRTSFNFHLPYSTKESSS